jgi:hypothetical protein
VYRLNPTLLGSNENWNSLYVDVRKYLPLNPQIRISKTRWLSGRISGPHLTAKRLTLIFQALAGTPLTDLAGAWSKTVIVENLCFTWKVNTDGILHPTAC